MNSDKFCNIYLVRHGHSEGNEKDIFGTDPQLTDLGKQQAKELAEQLKGVHFDGIFASTLIRAKQTAEVIALEKKIAVQTTELLKERYWGEFEGKIQKQVIAELGHLFEKAKTLNIKERSDYRLAPHVETEEEMMARFITALREIAVAYSGKNVLIVSHQYILRLFLLHIGYLTVETFYETSLGNSGYINIESDGVEFIVKEIQGIRKGPRPY